MILLPLADLGDNGWRIAFAASALVILLIPSLRRHLQETGAVRTGRGARRQTGPRSARSSTAGTACGSCCSVWLAFLTNVFQAPSSQLANRYLHREHGFSNSETALFRSVTAGVPGIIGVLLGGRLAESRGRRPVTIIGIVIASGFQMAFFLERRRVALDLARRSRSSPRSPAALRSARSTPSCSRPKCAARRTGSCSCAVSSARLSAWSWRPTSSPAVGGLGPAIALCGIAPLIAACFVVPRLPETADRRLDDISPTETPDRTPDDR